MDAPSPLTPDLLLQHESFVLGLARGLVRDDATARDIAQETMMSALRAPPQPSALRSWLARVVKHRAADARTRSRRRERREELAARPEAVDAATTASERLELQHGVVTAVLALDEPYRGVVIATYFEGLTPNELAARRGVPPATVRSQLSRALEQLRVKLDREHGDRSAWSVALVGSLRGRAELARASATSSSVAWIAAVGAVMLFLGATYLAWPRKAKEHAPIAGLDVPPTHAAQDALAVGNEFSSARSPAITRRELPRDRATLDDLPALLERMRQIKRLVLERRLAVPPEDRERFAWLESSGTGGVTKLRGRGVDGDALDLPWARGGGESFSFSERVHDSNRDPQIRLDNGHLTGVVHGFSEWLLLDLGELELSAVPRDASTPPPGLDARDSFVWRAIWAPISEERREAAYALRDEMDATLDLALIEGRIEWADHGRLAHGNASDALRALPGHTYLMRAREFQGRDVIVALHLLRAAHEECTMAWQLLDSRPVADAQAPPRPAVLSEEVPPAPPEIARLSTEELLAELEQLVSLGDAALFDGFPGELTARFAELLDRREAGLVRLIGSNGPWTEIARRRGGGATFSFSGQGHTSAAPDLELQGAGEQATLACDFPGDDTGAVIDLGTVAFAALDEHDAAGIAHELGELVVGSDFPQRTAPLPEEPGERARAEQAFAETVRRAANRFETELYRLHGASKAPVVLGHTYLVRSIRVERRDVLALVHVAGVDDYGVILAWRLLRSRSTERPRR